MCVSKFIREKRQRECLVVRRRGGEEGRENDSNQQKMGAKEGD